MVLADGVIDARELETLYKIGIEQYGLTQSEINEAVRDAGTSFITPSAIQDKIKFLYNMAQIAYADGEIDFSEIQLLKRYIVKMGFADENIDKISDYLLAAAKNQLTINEVLQNDNI